MTSTVETLSETRVRLAVEVPWADLEPTLKRAYRAVAQQVSIPGFRRGKVPPAVIDQRVGRGAVLNEAIQEAIPEQLVAAYQEHDLKVLGRPEVEVTELSDGEPLKFTAEVDIRPEVTLPDPASLEVTVDALEIDEAAVDEQVHGLRQRFATLKTVERPAAEGDYVQIDLVASVDGAPVPGGSAENISHEVGSKQLLEGLDDALVGMAAGDEATFETTLVGGDFAGRTADVAVTVRTVKEKELPVLDDDFAQLASEFDTLEELRADSRERLTRVKRVEQVYAARDKLLEALVEATAVPAPEGVVREEVTHRKQAMVDQLERMGANLTGYLAAEEKTEEQLDAELNDAAVEAVKIQIILDALAEAEKVEVSDDEFGREIVQRAQRSGMQPQQYYDQLARSGAAGAVYGDVRRGKALSMLMEKATLRDSAGNTIDLDAVREGGAAAAAAQG
ncbi:MAG TPA: trigger factor [Pilimelia sp.]|nr:trigger factor [Pilimelia sp.]